MTTVVVYAGLNRAVHVKHLNTPGDLVTGETTILQPGESATFTVNRNYDLLIYEDQPKPVAAIADADEDEVAAA